MILSSIVQVEDKLKNFLKEEFGLSSRIITRLRKEKYVYVNGKYRYMDYLLSPGDEVKVRLDFDINTFPREKIEIDVVYEDDALIVVNKDPNMTVHPTKGTPSGTLLNALGHYAYEKGEDYKIRFANRLDKDTSGLIIIAKNKYIDHLLSKQFVERSPEKFYLALVEGNCPLEFSFEGKMGRLGEEFKRSIIPEGKDSLTYFRTLNSDGKISLISAKPITGRTHQIRLHLSELGYPILGDELYGYSGNIKRTMLHCERMIIIHPLSGKRLELYAPLKLDMKEALEALDE